jgi:hypothetical protein
MSYKPTVVTLLINQRSLLGNLVDNGIGGKIQAVRRVEALAEGEGEAVGGWRSIQLS